MAKAPLTTIFTTGDNVYPVGAPEEFEKCYAPTWGRHKLRTFPVIGNHDAYTDKGKPYHDYFGERAGKWGESFASLPVGTWKAVALNSNCNHVDCSAAGPQYAWLKAVLAGHEGAPGAPTGACTVVAWHHPRFSSGPHGNTEAMQDVWALLVEHRVELVLNGHDHDYERFTAFDAQGQPAAGGVVQVVVGTGGKEAYPMGPPRPGSQFQFTGLPALLALDLAEKGYQGRFATADGRIRDRFEGTCR